MRKCKCCPEADLTTHDRREIDGFRRYLRMVSVAPTYRVNGREVHIIDHFWMAYALGTTGAPPLLWEGDNA